MNQKILILLILLNCQFLFSQASLLKSHGWKLEEFRIDNVSYLPPSNDELDFVFLNFSESNTENGGYFGSITCNYLYGNVEISENEFNFLSVSNSNLDCQLAENSEFDFLYFQTFYLNNTDNPFSYFIEEINNWLYLTITNANQDTARYSVYLNETLLSNEWILDKLNYNNQEIYPPQELLGEIVLLFPENNTSSLISSVCNTFWATVNTTETTIILDEYAISDVICEYVDFDDIYIQAFLGNWMFNTVFEYNITSDEEFYYLTLTDAWGNQAFYRTDNLSIRQIENFSLSIYPNPTQDYIQINSPENIQKINVLDMSGKLLKTFYNQTQINLSDLPIGIYLIQIETETQKVIKKVVKK